MMNLKDIQFCIDNRIVNYNHLADKSDTDKYTAEYKLKLVMKILPKFLVENKDKYKNWLTILDENWGILGLGKMGMAIILN